MAQIETQTNVTAQTFPDRLYGMDCWGNDDVAYLPEADAREMLTAYAAMDADFTADLDDCTEYLLHTVLDAQRAVYEGAIHADAYQRNARRAGVLFERDGTSFRRIETADTAERLLADVADED